MIKSKVVKDMFCDQNSYRIFTFELAKLDLFLSQHINLMLIHSVNILYLYS